MVMVLVLVIGLITAIVLIALGLLAAYSSVIVRHSDAQSYFDPVSYQGWLSCICGIWVLFNGVLLFIATPTYSLYQIMPAAFVALVGAIEVVLGLLLGYLGYALMTKRGERVRQTKLGYLAVVFGVLAVYPTLFFLFLSLGPAHSVPVQ